MAKLTLYVLALIAFSGGPQPAIAHPLVSAATSSTDQPADTCTYTPNQTSATLPASGGSGSFVITASPSDCQFPSFTWIGPITVISSLSQPVLTLNYTAGANTTGGTFISA